MRPFRFAVYTWGAPTGEAWAALAQRAEALGYDTLLVPDHLGRQWSPVPALAAAAAVTQRLRIGPYVFANDFRHPLMMAREAATLDALSGGRLELGLGAGWRTTDYRQLGYDYPPPGRRIDRLEEALGIVKRLLAGERVTHEGRFYKIRGAVLRPKPVQAHVPLHIGAGGPRMLRIAAREADIVGLIPQFTRSGIPNVRDASEGALARKVELLRQAAGPRFDRLELSVYCADAGVVGRSASLARAVASAVKGGLVAPVGSPFLLFGTPGGLRERLLRRRERLGISHYAIPHHAMEELAPLVEELAGR
ncbi:MAG TPA: TIGR03621 family F420-dependent LLM class oxidoreductase [candidate division Zixibacteria bacterium]|nr:TIGR03621 family F420-dependent LLM class oxidoreductase [candidate division Zixibacteria bacterium]